MVVALGLFVACSMRARHVVVVADFLPSTVTRLSNHRRRGFCLIVNSMLRSSFMHLLSCVGIAAWVFGQSRPSMLRSSFTHLFSRVGTAAWVFHQIPTNLHQSLHKEQTNPINPYFFISSNVQRLCLFLKSREVGIGGVGWFSESGLIKIDWD